MPLLESVPYKYYAHQDSTHTDSRFPGQTFVDAQYHILTQLATNSRTGLQNVNWKQQVSEGIDATTDYERIWSSGRSCQLFAHSVSNSPSISQIVYGSSLVHFQDGFGLINSGDDSALRDQALNRLKRRLSDNIGSFDSVVPVVELRELRGLVRNTAELASQVVRELIDIRNSRRRSLFQHAADAWLTFSFGVAPLISDTKKATESIASYLEREDRSVTLSGTASKTWNSGLHNTGYTGTYLCPHERVVNARHTLSYRYTAGLKLNLKSSNNYGYTDHFGIGLGQLPSLAWELTPYSWVVDYFTTVGQYLGDTFVLPPGSTKYLVLNKRYTMEAVISGSHSAVSNVGTRTVLLSNLCMNGYANHIRLVRTKLSSLPRAALRFKTVDEIGTNVVNRLLNLASLLVSGSSAFERTRGGARYG